MVSPVNLIQLILEFPKENPSTSILFLCYINDLSSSIQCKIELYASDTILYSIIHTLSDCITLQKHLDSLAQWATKLEMYFNPDKSEHRKITYPDLLKYTLKNLPIKEVPSAKYFGITITNKLTCSTHINNITNKALSAKAFYKGT